MKTFRTALEYFEIIPLYNGNNLSFFKKFIFIHIDDLKLKKIIKNQYFANQTFNINNYGKITILSNGDFYANLNQPKLGNINKDSLYDVLCLEIYNGKSWNFIRNVTPCKECVFQYICPPISNYELVIGKYDLCHVS